MSDSTVILIVASGLVMLTLLPFYLRQRTRERRSAHAQERAAQFGLHEPVTLHPIVKAEACIGTGNCIAVCPEGDVLGLRDGQAVAVAPANCVGHGLCERACPVEAIQLVFGSEQRGVEIPRVKADFETNVPGLYVVGELGGMGLIRNAFAQGRQCVDAIAKLGRSRSADVLDLVVVGCGPAGLATSLNALHRGLRFRTIEREDIGGTVRYFPRKKIVMTAPVQVPGYGELSFRELAKEDLIGVWEDIITKTGLEVSTGETVQSVTRSGDTFTVTTTLGAYRARRVVLAIGRRGIPRKLGVPGENLPKVIYSLREPETYRGDRTVVVGGGDSAVEAALALAEQPGTEVRLSYRGDRFTRIKPANRERIERAQHAGLVTILWSTNIVAIDSDTVTYRNGSGPRTIPNDLVAIFAGGELPTKFLQECGVKIDIKFGTP